MHSSVLQRPLCRLLFATLVVVSLNFAAVGQAAEVEISVAEDEQTAQVTIGGELFAVLQRSSRWAKPFIYPVLRPGWSDVEFDAGHGIVVADTAVLNKDGEPTGVVVASASRVAILKKAGDLYEVPDAGGYLAVADVVPESALVVRTMEDLPMPYHRKNKKAYDHKHHRGIWLTVDEVNGVKYWNEDGKVRPEKIAVAGGEDSGASLTLVNSWLGVDGEPVVRETTTYQFHPNHLIVAGVDFQNVTEGEVTFEDTKEGLFAIRVASELREQETGKITDVAGRVGEKNVWGHENRWVDYTGTKAGHTIGITILDHPKNSRPSRYHVRGYGLFAINPFGQHAYSNKEQPTNHLVLKPEESASYQFGMWIHGDVDLTAIQQVEEQFSALTPAE